MTGIMFSEGFDILYNNITSSAAPGVDNFEKAFFLNKSQEELIKNYANPKGNKYQEGVDDSKKRHTDFSALITTHSCKETGDSGYDTRSKVFMFPENFFILLNEQLLTNKGIRQVIPVSYREYARLMSKPLKEPLKYQAWRIDTLGEGSYVEAEIITHSDEEIRDYRIRYIRVPKPFTEDCLSLNEEVCELNESMHNEILQRAVELAKAVYTGDTNGLMQIGQRSE